MLKLVDDLAANAKAIGTDAISIKEILQAAKETVMLELKNREERDEQIQTILSNAKAGVTDDGKLFNKEMNAILDKINAGLALIEGTLPMVETPAPAPTPEASNG